jgi:hypothetical protein
MIDNRLIISGVTNLPGLSTSDIEKLLEWHDNNKKTLINQGSLGLKKPWVHTKIRDTELLKKSVFIDNKIPGSAWNKDFIENFSNLVEIFDQLPFTFIEKIIILETIKDCEPHIDASSKHYQDNSLEPCNYRMLLRKLKPTKGFYLQGLEKKDFGITPQKNVKTSFPKQYFSPTIGKWWVLNNWCCQHGSDWIDGDSKTLISVLGTPSTSHLNVLNSLSDMVLHPCVYENSPI